MYSWPNDIHDGHYEFYGFTNTKLYFSSKLQEWRIELLSNPSVYASLAVIEYPFGTHSWVFHGLSCDGKRQLPENTTETVELNFNACKNDEFNCADGGYNLLSLV